MPPGGKEKGVIVDVKYAGWQHDPIYTVKNGKGEKKEVDAYAVGTGLGKLGDKVIIKKGNTG